MKKERGFSFSEVREFSSALGEVSDAIEAVASMMEERGLDLREHKVWEFSVAGNNRERTSARVVLYGRPAFETVCKELRVDLESLRVIIPDDRGASVIINGAHTKTEYQGVEIVGCKLEVDGFLSFNPAE